VNEITCETVTCPKRTTYFFIVVNLLFNKKNIFASSRFLVEFGCDVNAPDSDGWTPLHCAASCNNLPMVRFLVEHGACIFATTLSDHETAAEKCEEDEEGFDGCSEYLYGVQVNFPTHCLNIKAQKKPTGNI